MKKYFILALMIVLMLCGRSLLGVNDVFALSFSGMTEITVNDGIDNSTGSSPLGIAGEDNETEYTHNAYGDGDNGTTIASQEWDFEGMFFDGLSLYIVGGFDFKNGVDNETLGDLFFSDNSGNYVYAIDSSDGKMYKNFSTTEPWYVKESSPFEIDGGSSMQNIYNIKYGVATDTGFNGWDYSNADHNFIQYEGDWSFLITDASHVHLTMSCGNDSIDGNLAPVPEPTTILLSGLGLLGMGVFIRRKRKLESEVV